MQPLKIGVQLASLRQPLKQALHTAARLGVQAVEIDARQMLRPEELTDTGARHLRKMLEEWNLTICAIGFRTRRGYGELDQLDRRVDATKQALRFAYRLGARIVVNHLGPIPEDPAGPEGVTLREVLNDIGRYGQHVGATLAVETETEEGARLAALIDLLEPGAVGVTLNPGALVINGFHPIEAVEHLGQHVMYVHATDGVCDRARRRGLETPLGRGTADLPEIVARLEEFRYRGYYTIERRESSDPVTEISQAVSYLRNLVE